MRYKIKFIKDNYICAGCCTAYKIKKSKPKKNSNHVTLDSGVNGLKQVCGYKPDIDSL